MSMSKMGLPQFKVLLVCIDNGLELRVDEETKSPII